MEKINFGKIIKEERKKQGISVFRLARATGFTERAFYHWENEERDISLENAHIIANALGITVTIGVDKERRVRVDSGRRNESL